ncbi:MAG: McrC family protein [bacterium]
MNSKASVQKTITLREFGEVSLLREDFSFCTESEFKKTCEKFQPLVTVIPDLSGRHLAFKASSKVGVMVYKGLRVQVLPRTSAKEFCTLIRYVLDGNVPEKLLRSYSDLSWGNGFEDILCAILCKEVDEVLRIGLSRNYMKRVEPLNVLRGRPLWERNFPWKGSKAKEIVCRYHCLTYNNLDNRMVLAGLKSAASLAKSANVKRGTLQHVQSFREFASDIFPDHADFDKAIHGYNRLNEHYGVAHGLSKMLVFGLRPESFFKEGMQEVFGIVLDMAHLFEGFVERLMTDVLERVGFSIRRQAPDRNALLDNQGCPYARVRPDLEIWRSGKVFGVMDAKYKPYWKASKDGPYPERKISNEDFYQLFFYQQRLQRRGDLSSPPTALIASPLPDFDEREDRAVISERFRRIVWQAGPERDGDIRLVFIPMTQFLRLLEKGFNPSAAIHELEFNKIDKLFLAEKSLDT